MSNHEIAPWGLRYQIKLGIMQNKEGVNFVSCMIEPKQ